MLPDQPVACPDCESTPRLGRRDFIRVLGVSAVAAALPAAPGLTPLAKARAARTEKQAKAEQLVFELFASMDADQKKSLVLPWDAGVTAKGGIADRLKTHNAPVGKSVIGLQYNKKQVELLDRIFRSIANGEEGYKKLSRNGKFDNSGDFESSGALIYGEPAEGKKFSLVFASHHLTVRCDGNSEEKMAFGGPLYYGHSPSGYATTNVFHHQTKALNELFASLNEKQQTAAVMPGKWKDEHSLMKTPGKADKLPGIVATDVTKDQKSLVESVMKELVSPYRKEDGDEVMELIKANGGMEKLSFAFYKEGTNSAKEPWTFWRLEGPGFIWSFRALPHIHTFVNINAKMA
jgi:hypothetical protein